MSLYSACSVQDRVGLWEPRRWPKGSRNLNPPRDYGARNVPPPHQSKPLRGQVEQLHIEAQYNMAEGFAPADYVTDTGLSELQGKRLWLVRIPRHIDTARLEVSAAAPPSGVLLGRCGAQ